MAEKNRMAIIAVGGDVLELTDNELAAVVVEATPELVLNRTMEGRLFIRVFGPANRGKLELVLAFRAPTVDTILDKILGCRGEMTVWYGRGGRAFIGALENAEEIEAWLIGEATEQKETVARLTGQLVTLPPPAEWEWPGVEEFDLGYAPLGEAVRLEPRDGGTAIVFDRGEVRRIRYGRETHRKLTAAADGAGWEVFDEKLGGDVLVLEFGEGGYAATLAKVEAAERKIGPYKVRVAGRALERIVGVVPERKMRWLYGLPEAPYKGELRLVELGLPSADADPVALEIRTAAQWAGSGSIWLDNDGPDGPAGTTEEGGGGLVLGEEWSTGLVEWGENAEYLEAFGLVQAGNEIWGLFSTGTERIVPGSGQTFGTEAVRWEKTRWAPRATAVALKRWDGNGLAAPLAKDMWTCWAGPFTTWDGQRGLVILNHAVAGAGWTLHEVRGGQWMVLAYEEYAVAYGVRIVGENALVWGAKIQPLTGSNPEIKIYGRSRPAVWVVGPNGKVEAQIGAEFGTGGAETSFDRGVASIVPWSGKLIAWLRGEFSGQIWCGVAESLDGGLSWSRVWNVGASGTVESGRAVIGRADSGLLFCGGTWYWYWWPEREQTLASNSSLLAAAEDTGTAWRAMRAPHMTNMTTAYRIVPTKPGDLVSEGTWPGRACVGYSPRTRHGVFAGTTKGQGAARAAVFVGRKMPLRAGWYDVVLRAPGETAWWRLELEGELGETAIGARVRAGASLREVLADGQWCRPQLIARGGGVLAGGIRASGEFVRVRVEYSGAGPGAVLRRLTVRGERRE